MTKSFGIIGGSGKQGSALARRLLNADYQVRIGSRSEDRGKQTAEELNNIFSTDLASGGDNSYACDADVIVLAIPFDQVEPLLSPLEQKFEGKIIIDMTVNLEFGKYIETKMEDGKSSYEYIQVKFDKSDVVMSLKTISYIKLAELVPLNQTDFQMTLSDEAFEFTSKLVEKFGLQAVRVRGKVHSHTIERMVALSIQLNKEYKGTHGGYLFTGLKL